jgi:hypothetical protein
MIISLPVHTAVCASRPEGALATLVATQLFAPGLYFPPVFKKTKLSPCPPQTIISLPAHTAVWRYRASGAFVVLVAVQTSMSGLYFPPVFTPL